MDSANSSQMESRSLTSERLRPNDCRRRLASADVSPRGSVIDVNEVLGRDDPEGIGGHNKVARDLRGDLAIKAQLQGSVRVDV